MVNHKEGTADEGLNAIYVGNANAADEDDPPLLRQLKANAHIIPEDTATDKDSQVVQLLRFDFDNSIKVC